MTSKVYEFRVDGRLPDCEREEFADLSLEEVPAGLILRGEVLDESHLHGIIARFRAHGLIIVSAQPVGE
jgi:hypothetical protein